MKPKLTNRLQWKTGQKQNLNNQQQKKVTAVKQHYEVNEDSPDFKIQRLAVEWDFETSKETKSAYTFHTKPSKLTDIHGRYIKCFYIASSQI